MHEKGTSKRTPPQQQNNRSPDCTFCAISSTSSPTWWPEWTPPTKESSWSFDTIPNVFVPYKWFGPPLFHRQNEWCRVGKSHQCEWYHVSFERERPHCLFWFHERLCPERPRCPSILFRPSRTLCRPSQSCRSWLLGLWQSHVLGATMHHTIEEPRRWLRPTRIAFVGILDVAIWLFVVF